MVRPHRQGGIEPVRTFFGQGWEGNFFSILCGRLLRTAPYTYSLSNQFQQLKQILKGHLITQKLYH